ncbi:MAG TPA: transaldolase family protein [Salinisphaeraceae bacterium]|nr:transaldolase family protein [Salinisphaeraceae bacterium]
MAQPAIAGNAAVTAANALEALRQYSTIVADSGDFTAIRQFRPTDATTNPSLVLKAVQDPAYAALQQQLHALPTMPGLNEVDQLMLLFGRELSAVVSQRVSTEVDAALSFDSAATIAKARALIAGYAALGVPAERILIKIAATWEGIRAAQVLEAEGIRCNMTLIFALCQAQACFDAGATLVSPFVGRITDWYKQAWGVPELAVQEDPGVLGVRRISAYARAHGYPTQIMAASFRHSGQILALAGVDLLTIAPALLGELATMAAADVTAPQVDDESPAPRATLDQARFAWAMCENAMAGDRLADGIRRFAKDQAELAAILQA